MLLSSAGAWLQQHVEEAHAAGHLVVHQQAFLHAHQPADVAPQVHRVLRLLLAELDAHHALAEEVDHAEAQVGGQHVGLVDRLAQFSRIPLGHAAHALAHHRVDQAHAHRALEAGAVTRQAAVGGDVQPPLGGLGHAALGALGQGAGEHQRAVDGRGLVAGHQRGVAQHTHAQAAGDVAGVGTRGQARLVHPGGAGLHCREEVAQFGRGVGHAGNAVLQRLLETRHAGLHAAAAHAQRQAVGYRIAAGQRRAQGVPFGRAGLRVHAADQHAQRTGRAAGLDQVRAVATGPEGGIRRDDPGRGRDGC
ncbi:MAG: hypothetical protein QM765_11710 [Myxococcales bacterium]